MSENESEKSLVSRRKTFSIITILVGIPNLLLALLTTFGGLILSVLLAILVFSFLSGDGTNEPLGDACIAIVAVILVIFLVFAVIATILSVLFAFAVGGQTIGGFRSYKGHNFVSSLVLIFLGSGAAFIVGTVLTAYGILADIDTGLRVVSIGAGAFELLSFMISLFCGIMIRTTRETFVSKKGRLHEIRNRIGRKG